MQRKRLVGVALWPKAVMNYLATMPVMTSKSLAMWYKFINCGPHRIYLEYSQAGNLDNFGRRPSVRFWRVCWSDENAAVTHRAVRFKVKPNSCRCLWRVYFINSGGMSKFKKRLSHTSICELHQQTEIVARGVTGWTHINISYIHVCHFIFIYRFLVGIYCSI